LHHGNNNIYILFLIAATLTAWRKGYDVLAGLILAYAIAFKVTPGLFLLYFAYKRSWRTVGATILGLGLFFFVVPSLLLGYDFNSMCLESWWKRILSPYVDNDFVSPQEMNQSLVGVLTRLLTENKVGVERYDNKLHVNFLVLDHKSLSKWLKGLSIGLVGLLAWLCRTKSERRDDPRLLGEFSLVVLTMLFISERSWKHHYVTLLLPYTYLAYRVGVAGLPKRTRWVLGGVLGASAFLIATTSSEVGGLFAHGQGHKVAQAYGMFLWSGVVLYIATAWRVVAERKVPPATIGLGAEPSSTILQGPHCQPTAVVRRDREP
jgi:alpha-1,2-mannosyltransferase